MKKGKHFILIRNPLDILVRYLCNLFTGHFPHNLQIILANNSFCYITQAKLQNCPSKFQTMVNVILRSVSTKKAAISSQNGASWCQIIYIIFSNDFFSGLKMGKGSFAQWKTTAHLMDPIWGTTKRHRTKLSPHLMHSGERLEFLYSLSKDLF